MNFRIRTKKDMFFFIIAILVSPLIAFFVDLYTEKKRIKDFNFLLGLDLFCLVGFIFFIVFVYVL